MFVNYLNNLPYCLISTIGSIFIANTFINKSFKKNFSYNAIIILIYSLLNCGMCTKETNVVQIVLFILTMTLSIKYIYDFSMVSSSILSIVTIIVILLSKILISFPYFAYMNEVKLNKDYLLIINIITLFVAYLITKINFIQRIVKPLIKRYEHKVIKGELIFLILIILIISFFNYQMLSNRYLDTCNICFLLFIFMLIVFSMTYIWNKNRYKELKDSYDNLFEFACLYEDELEKDKLLRHEYKNQLAVIKGLTKDEKVLEHIDQMLEHTKKEDIIDIKGLNNIPKGGLRGLFYYKISTIKKNNINFSIDISRSVKKHLSNLKIEEIKSLTYILGILCDNAIDECIKNKNSNISIEIYNIGMDINIVISNTIIDKVNLNKMGQKGYTTKGDNRGNGLYLVKKLINNNEKIFLSTKLINNYFVQEIKIKNI